MRIFPDITYNALFAVLRAQGFVDVPNTKARVWEHPATGAELILPKVDDDEPLRSHHYGAARAVMGDYDIMTREQFDLTLLGATHRVPVTV